MSHKATVKSIIVSRDMEGWWEIWMIKEGTWMTGRDDIQEEKMGIALFRPEYERTAREIAEQMGRAHGVDVVWD